MRGVSPCALGMINPDAHNTIDAQRHVGEPYRMGVNGTHNTVGENVGAYNTICVKEVPIDRPLLGVDELRNATQKHCCSSDVWLA